jgi:hypothetical protein
MPAIKKGGGKFPGLLFDNSIIEYALPCPDNRNSSF